MKRTLILLAVLMLCIPSFARVYVGGHIGISTSGDRIGINVAPEVGYRINNSFDVGGLLSYQSLYSTFGVTPYARWHFVSFGDRVNMFIEANTPMRFANNYQSYGFIVRPGVTVRLSDNVWLMGKVGRFGYEYVKSGDIISSGWLARLNGDSITIGFCFGF